MMRILLTGFIFVLCFSVSAATPQNVNYQGVLTDSAGIPITTPTTVTIVARVFDGASGGTELYSETHSNVTVEEGVFSLVLGSGSTPTGSFSASTFAANTTWLQLEIEGEAQSPRQAFLSVPYALHAEDAAQLDGNNASAFALATDITSLQNQIGLLNILLSQLQASVGSNSSSITTLQTDVANNASGVANNDNDINNYHNLD